MPAAPGHKPLIHSPMRSTVASLRGKVHRYRVGDREVPLVVTYHPAYLLRNLADKSKSWADLCLARDTIAGRGGEDRQGVR